MTRIGLLSDTHGYLHPRVSDFFKDCDEIWHAGDIGNIEVAEYLSALKPFRAVYGNIDGGKLRILFNEYLFFTIEKVKVLMIHIGGYPQKYSSHAKRLIASHKPQLFISGHSHVLKVMNDDVYGLLHINPGAAGKNGFHRKITMVRFVIEEENIREFEVFEADR